jgi:hypothetical protein
MRCGDRFAAAWKLLWTPSENAMRTLVLVVALSVAGTAASAAPRPRTERAVTIASSSDESPGVLDAHARTLHGAIVRRALLDVLQRSGANVRHAGIGPRQIDVAVVAWHIAATAAQLSVMAELRVVVCDDRGRMLSIVTGRASVSAPLRAARLEELREQALAEAVGAMSRSLYSQLARATS